MGRVREVNKLQIMGRRVGPCDPHPGGLLVLIEVRLLPSHSVWEAGPHLQVLAGTEGKLFWQP